MKLFDIIYKVSFSSPIPSSYPGGFHLRASIQAGSNNTSGMIPIAEVRISSANATTIGTIPRIFV